MRPGRGLALGVRVADGEVIADAEEALWERVRADYDAGMTHQDLVAKHAIKRHALIRRMKTHLWPVRRHSRLVDRPAIITRMFRVLERQVMDLEMEMTDLENAKRRSGDKEVVLLGKLAGTLDKLMEFDREAGEGRRTKLRTKQMADIRSRLIERIEQLKRD